MAYGYEPANYMQDFSWIGDIGKAISATALKMPELIELNRSIKENNKFKELTYDATNKYIDQLDIEKVSNILSAMGMAEDVKVGEQNARNRLKSLVPKYEDSSSNEDYASKITNSFFVPFMQAAQSEAGGGVLKFGDLFGNLRSGTLQEAIRESSVGKEVRSQELEQQQYELGRTREEEEYQKGFGRKYGPAGEVQTQNLINRGEQQNLYEQQQQQKETEAQQLAKDVNTIMSKVQSSSDVWSQEFDILSPAARDKAYQILRDQESDDLRRQLKEMDQRLRGLTTGRNKPVASDEFDKLDNSINSVIDRETGRLQRLEQLKKDKVYDPLRYKQEKARISGKIKELEIRRDINQKAKMEFLKNKNYTVGGQNVAVETATQEKTQELSDLEKAFIKKYNEGGYRQLLKSRKGEQQDFIDAYVREFGKEPRLTAIEQAVSQMEGSTGVSGGVRFNVGSGTTGAIDKSKAIKVTDQTKPESIPDGQLITYNGKYYIKNGNKLQEVQ